VRWKHLLLAFWLVVLSAGYFPALSYQPTVTNSEVDCLARTIYYEARSESIAGRIAVAHVVLNRVASGYYGKSICAVVTQDTGLACQFSWYCNYGTVRPEVKEDYTEARSLAKRLLAPDNSILDPTHGALYYTEISLKPAWAKHFRNYIIIGRHKFYFERKEYP